MGQSLTLCNPSCPSTLPSLRDNLLSCSWLSLSSITFLRAESLVFDIFTKSFIKSIKNLKTEKDRGARNSDEMYKQMDEQTKGSGVFHFRMKTEQFTLFIARYPEYNADHLNKGTPSLLHHLFSF